MTVYADILVIVNLYIDFFLLWCVKKALHLPARGARMALGALLGGLCSLTALLRPPPWASLALGALSAVAAAGAAFWPLKPRLLLRSTLCFWGFSLGLAGFFLFLLRFAAPKSVAVLGSVVYFDLSPGLLFLFTCGAYGAFALGRRLLPKDSPGERYQAFLIENRGTAVKLWAKADTGNSLREPFSGLPVIICQKDGLGDAVPPEVLGFLESGAVAAAPPEGIRLVPFESLGGAGVLPAFRPLRAALAKTGAPLDCWVAVCRQRLSAGQFNALYNPDLLR